MFVVFVTGPLASGKRSACLYLAEHGFAHIDLDTVAKEFLDDELVVAELVRAYGTTICNEKGSIDKARLAELAFVDEESSAALNGIIWPKVTERLGSLLVGQSCQKDEADTRVVVEIPLLAEAPDLLDLADTVLTIAADEGLRTERALERGMPLADIKKRMALQASDDERAAISDAVIENNGSIEALHHKLDAWMRWQEQEHLF